LPKPPVGRISFDSTATADLFTRLGCKALQDAFGPRIGQQLLPTRVRLDALQRLAAIASCSTSGSFLSSEMALARRAFIGAG
jgi:hypothetical protein